ncbi:HAMP domain-containing sensor histidine kinase [Solibacillus sp. CAU 1738]|uniref:sensor histidine kinase n=1 Tax=Solibacillus sp. CAU 1738 TaxID=3140363 RepID=UPI00326131AA
MKRQIIKLIQGLMFFILYIVSSFSIAYFLIERIPIQTSGYFQFIFTIITGFSFMFLLATIIHFILPNRRKNFYLEVISALRKISSGDFNVYLDIKMNERNEFTELVDQFNHMVKQLQQMEDMRQEFISNVSHEIQSPLTSIIGFAQALQNNQLSKEQHQRYLNIIETECRRLSKLSDNLMKLTSLESENHTFEKKNYPLDQQLRAIILACEPHWDQKNIEFDIHLEKITLLADEDLMSQVWTNLIHNCIKFTPEHGKITIQLEKKVHKAVVTISDTGIGISKADQPHIFERFYKADVARVRSNSGSGLGLSIVKKIVEMHNGTIIVQSEMGKGTTFIITIPVF